MSLAFCLLVGEASTRWYLHHHPTSPEQGSITIDEELGWRTTENFAFRGQLTDAAGRPYSVDVRTDERGSRLFGEPGSRLRKVLVVGDSFTYAAQVSNDRTFYGLLDDKLPQIEVFAYGGNGYGTLQELMVLDGLLDEVEPDALILQLCENDIINNSYDLERRSAANNNGMRRPYLGKDGEIFYALPKGYFPRFREFANNYSRFLYLILSRIDRLYSNEDTASETLLFEQGRKSRLIEDGLELTEELLRRIRARVPPEVEVYAFSIEDAPHPMFDEFRRMTDAVGIEFIEEVPQALRAAENAGTTIRASDHAHWNEKGHEIVANVLATYFASRWE